MDSNSIYWPEALPLPLANPSIQAEARNEQTVMETGRVRVRPTVESLYEIYEVEWNLTADKFEAFKAFFEDDLEHGSLPFVLELLGEETEVEFLEADTFEVNHTDNLFNLKAKLCIVPQPIPPPEPENPVYETFDHYDDQVDVLGSELNLGVWNNFSHSYLQPMYGGLVAQEGFEAYADEADVGPTDINRGTGWNGVPYITQMVARQVASEDFDAYADGAVTGSDLSGGTGWTGIPSISAF